MKVMKDKYYIIIVDDFMQFENRYGYGYEKYMLFNLLSDDRRWKKVFGSDSFEEMQIRLDLLNMKIDVTTRDPVYESGYTMYNLIEK